MREKKPCRIITFYSYKGGTGRTMLLANVAWILAAAGKRVLAIDWDLEAPGLHRYFSPFLIDKELTSTPGVIDLVTEYAVEAVARGDASAEADADILRYVTALDWRFPKPGCLDLVPAGKQGPSYAARVNSFNWQNFYERLGGGAFLEAVKDSIRAEYDYALIDSRTGVSDTAGMCTVELPDDLVVCFTLNNQSIDGASAIAHSVVAQRNDDFHVFPVPTRVEEGEKKKLELARDVSRARFQPFIEHVPAERRGGYWGAVEVPYKIFYAYEEILGIFGDRPDQLNSLLASAERLTGYLTNGEVERLAPMAEAERKRVLLSFERTRRMEDRKVPSKKPLQDAAPPPMPAPAAAPAIAPSPSPAALEEAMRMGAENRAIARPTTDAPPTAHAPSKSASRAPTVMIAGVLAAVVALGFVGKKIFDLVSPGDGHADAGPPVVEDAGSSRTRWDAVVAAATASTDPLYRALLLAEIPDDEAPEGAVKLATEVLKGPIPRAVLGGFDREIKAVQYSADGKWIVAASKSEMRAWHTTGENDPVLIRGPEGISSLDVGHGFIAFGTADGVSGIWSLVDKPEQTPLKAAVGAKSTSVRFGGAQEPPPFELLQVVDGDVLFWEINKAPHGDKLTSKRIASIPGDGDKQILFADYVRSGSNVIVARRSLYEVWQRVEQAATAPGKTKDAVRDAGAATSFADSDASAAKQPAHVDYKSYATTLRVADTTSSVSGASYGIVGPRNDAIIIPTTDGTIRAFRLTPENQLPQTPLVLKKASSGTTAVAANDAVLAAGAREGDVQIWRWADAEPVHVGRHTKRVSAIALSPSDDRLVSGSDDGTAKVLDFFGNNETTLLGSNGSILFVLFGQHDEVVTVAADNMPRIWDIRARLAIPKDWPGLRKALRAATTVCLTQAQRTKDLGESPSAARTSYEACEREYKRTPASASGN